MKLNCSSFVAINHVLCEVELNPAVMNRVVQDRCVLCGGCRVLRSAILWEWRKRELNLVRRRELHRWGRPDRDKLHRGRGKLAGGGLQHLLTRCRTVHLLNWEKLFHTDRRSTRLL